MRLRRLLAMAYKETLQIWRDPRSLAIALLMPLMQMVLLGYGVSLDIKRVPLCVYDQEQSQLSRALVQEVVAGDWFSTVQLLGSNRAVGDAMDRRTCLAALVIPVDFSRRLARTESATVETILDATDANTSNIAIGYMQGAVAQASAEVSRAWAAARGQTPSAVGTIELHPRVWFNEGLDSRNFIVPGMVAVILSLVGAQLTSLTISREWERGTMEQLISTPVTSLEVMLGKLLPYFVIGFIDAAFCLLATAYWFGVPFRGSIGVLVATTVLFTMVVLGIGYLVSVRIRSQIGASQIALLCTMLPTMLLSGYTFPIDQMPQAVQTVSIVVYARYFVTILRAVFLKGSTLTDLAWPVLALTAYAVVIVWIAARAFHKRLD
jgi:ABC-2 type transport system permease protein